MVDYFHPLRVTIEGYECKLLERPLPCKKGKCNHIDYCRSCDACGMTVKGFVYHCSKKDWDFHPKCAKLEGVICVEDVIFKLKKQGPSKCLWCKKHHLQGASKNIQGWSYVSSQMGYSFHVYCVMDMAQQNNPSIGNGPDLILGLKEVGLPLQIKPNTANGWSKWIKIFQIFFKTVLAILFGDPTTILATTLAHIVTESLFHAG